MNNIFEIGTTKSAVKLTSIATNAIPSSNISVSLDLSLLFHICSEPTTQIQYNKTIIKPKLTVP